MKKAAAVTINNFTIIPVCRFVIELLSSRFSLSIAECKIKGSYDFEQYGKLTYLGSFDSKASFSNQTLLKKLNKYISLYRHIFSLLFIKKVDVLYTPDIHVLSAIFTLNKIAKRKISIIYHQFELLDPTLIKGSNLKLWNKMAKHINAINLCIFPEVNRLVFFCANTDFDRAKCIVFANSCKGVKESEIRPGILKNIPAGEIVIAHIGNVGTNHYLSNFLNFINRMNGHKNIHFLMIGRLSPDALSMLKKVRNENFHIIGEISHRELSNYYSFIDIGFILYKGLDLNLEYCAPNKLYEYWSHGIYVIAHPLKGLTGIINNDKMGTLINLENPLEIEEIVHRFSLIAGKKARQNIKMYFNSKYSVNESISLLNHRLDEFA